MARQIGPLFITGTIDDVVFYKLGEHYYIRGKGHYKSGKQLRRIPKYKRMLAKASQFGRASQLTRSIYYRQVPRGMQRHGVFGRMTGIANRALQGGKSEEEVLQLLLQYCEELQKEALVQAATPKKAKKGQKKATREVACVETTAAGASPVAKGAAMASAAGAEQLVNEKPVDGNKGAGSGKLTVRVKQARYLSSWKVKGNGRLQVSRPDSAGLALQPREKEKANVNKYPHSSCQNHRGRDRPL